MRGGWRCGCPCGCSVVAWFAVGPRCAAAVGTRVGTSVGTCVAEHSKSQRTGSRGLPGKPRRLFEPPEQSVRPRQATDESLRPLDCAPPARRGERWTWETVMAQTAYKTVFGSLD